MNSKLILFCSFCLVLLPIVAFAQFQPMVGIPGVDADAQVGDYINALYILAISIAAFLAVIKLIIAGVKYMLTDVVPSKQSAKNDIKGALIGLLIVIGAALILQTINPNLRVFSIFDTGLNCDGQDYCEEAPPAPGATPTVRPGLEAPEGYVVQTFPCAETNCDAARARCQNISDGAEYVGDYNNSVVCHVPNSAAIACEDGVSLNGRCVGESVAIGALSADMQTQPAAIMEAECERMAQAYRSSNPGYGSYESEVRSISNQATCVLFYEN